MQDYFQFVRAFANSFDDCTCETEFLWAKLAGSGDQAPMEDGPMPCRLFLPHCLERLIRLGQSKMSIHVPVFTLL